ncbi:MAG: hypothetical protein JXB18_02260 [Sedimentisphaerales bacterium]|nr:hypothetical protein [Sedimentisphaerales bacterium]
MLYHAILALCVCIVNRAMVSELTKGFSLPQSFLFGFAALLCGLVIYWFWPHAKTDTVDLSAVLHNYKLDGFAGGLFAAYSILVNPILEELFWRGCFNPSPRKPAFIDLAFAGYHGLALNLVLQPAYVIAVIILLIGVSWLFRHLKLANRGLAIPYIMHLAADISIIASIWMLSTN